MKKVAFHTLGCKVNKYETEAMEELFKSSGYEIVKEDDIADIYVINTCTVTNLSASKSRQFIRKAKRLNDNAVVAVVGCYSQVSPDEVAEIDGVDVIIGTNKRNQIVFLCEEAKDKKMQINIVKDSNEYKEFEEINVTGMDSMTRAYIKVQDGCNQFCSYCIIPYARGRIRSRDAYDIVEEIKDLADKGFKEVVLTGIHVASYGKDLSNMDLAMLIENIAKIDGIKRIRLSSIEQSIITDEFMKRIVNTNKVCDHFHLSLQSGSDTVLKRMNRKYTSSEYYEKVNLIRKYMPNAGITTDIIVGFPQETDEEFEETLEFVKKVKFSKIHVFKYSPREGTIAAKMNGQIDGNIKNERSSTLIELQDNLQIEFMKEQKDKILNVLFEEVIDDYLEGYSTNYLRVAIDPSLAKEGDIKEVKVIKCDEDRLISII